MAMHEREIALSQDTARTLVASQFPQWAHVPARLTRSSGTVNAILRIGDDHAARFPLQGDDPEDVRRLLEAEASASAELAQVSLVRAPVPVALGRPGAGYPLPWSVQTWLPGTDASTVDVAGSEDLARDLAALVLALRSADTRGRTFAGQGRGGGLSDHDAWVETCLARSEQLLDVRRLAATWQHLRELPRTSPDMMTHGDLIPANVLVADGRLAGVLDTGGFAAADPALDVIAGWHLLDDGPRAVFRAEVGSDDLEWERSRAWAFEQALGAVWYYARTNSAMSRMGRRTLARTTAAAPT